MFASAQSLIGFFALIAAILLNFDLITVNVSEKAFYVAMLIIFGFVFLAGGLFLIYDWWEKP